MTDDVKYLAEHYSPLEIYEMDDIVYNLLKNHRDEFFKAIAENIDYMLERNNYGNKRIHGSS